MVIKTLNLGNPCQMKSPKSNNKKEKSRNNRVARLKTIVTSPLSFLIPNKRKE
jgi:hypothetical protein